MKVPTAPIKNPHAFGHAPDHGVEGVLFKQKMLLDVECHFFPFNKPFLRIRNEDTAVEIWMVQRDAEPVKQLGEGNRILSCGLPVPASRAKISSVHARCDHCTTIPHFSNQRSDLQARIPGQQYIAVEPDSGIDVASDEFYQRRFVIPGVLSMAFGNGRIRNKELIVGFQEASRTGGEAEIAHLDCIGSSGIRKGLQEDQRLQEHPVIRTGNKLHVHSRF